MSNQTDHKRLTPKLRVMVHKRLTPKLREIANPVITVWNLPGFYQSAIRPIMKG